MTTSYAVRDRSDGMYLDGDFNWSPEPFEFAARPDAYALIQHWALGSEDEAERLDIIEVIDGVPRTRTHIDLDWHFYYDGGIVTARYECETSFCLLLYTHNDNTIVLDRARPVITQEWFVEAFRRFVHINDLNVNEFYNERGRILEAWNAYFA
jgi:hypothetical protein